MKSNQDCVCFIGISIGGLPSYAIVQTKCTLSTVEHILFAGTYFCENGMKWNDFQPAPHSNTKHCRDINFCEDLIFVMKRNSQKLDPRKNVVFYSILKSMFGPVDHNVPRNSGKLSTGSHGIALFTIFLNMVSMGIEHYNQSRVITFTLEICNALFTTIFSLGKNQYYLNMRCSNVEEICGGFRGHCQDRRTEIPIFYCWMEHLRLRPGHRQHRWHRHGRHDGGFPGFAHLIEGCQSL